MFKVTQLQYLFNLTAIWASIFRVDCKFHKKKKDDENTVLSGSEDGSEISEEPVSAAADKNPALLL